MTPSTGGRVIALPTTDMQVGVIGAGAMGAGISQGAAGVYKERTRRSLPQPGEPTPMGPDGPCPAPWA